ncbi:hypothetical protein TNCV_2141511 [Trichonephila clavipes]|uniref:Uncharacterized protein n=1 Tax=Trichonephila clavipes TaxID=2585209 RepID=A0A8X6VAV0_TRICX|nr:hypothetical protein TNCV_2141511 [Trichonephila clavipes]
MKLCLLHMCLNSINGFQGEGIVWKVMNVLGALGRKPLGGRESQRPPTSFPLPPTSRKDLRLDGYLEYHHTAKVLYIYKHPGFEPRPCSTAARVTNHKTRWAIRQVEQPIIGAFTAIMERYLEGYTELLCLNA